LTRRRSHTADAVEAALTSARALLSTASAEIAVADSQGDSSGSSLLTEDWLRSPEHILMDSQIGPMADADSLGSQSQAQRSQSAVSTAAPMPVQRTAPVAILRSAVQAGDVSVNAPLDIADGATRKRVSFALPESTSAALLLSQSQASTITGDVDDVPSSLPSVPDESIASDADPHATQEPSQVFDCKRCDVFHDVLIALS